VEEAVAKALRQLGLDRTRVDVEVVSQGRPGILGFGGEPARVIVRPRAAGVVPDEPDETSDLDEDDESDEAAPVTSGRRPPAEPVDEDTAIELAVEILEDLLDLLDIDAEVTPRPPSTPGDGAGMVIAVLDVEGEDLGMLIGRRGETLISLQYLLNLMLSRRVGARVMVGIDIGGYRRRREESLRGLALRTADRVRATGQSVTLEPMPPNERRIVHIALQDNPDVLTVSFGEGEGRKVAITPRR
jgi:spoIIIJ-associated protein